MTDTIDLLLARRSVPPLLLAEPGPDPEHLRTLLTVAARVPDHGKLAPWRFILFRGPARHVADQVVSEAFRAANPAAPQAVTDKEANRFSVSPLVVGVVSTAREHVKIPLWEQQLSAGAVCQNLVVAATAMGFAASWLSGWFAYDEAVLAELGIHPGERVAGFVHLGTARETLPDRDRPALDSLITDFT